MKKGICLLVLIAICSLFAQAQKASNSQVNISKLIAYEKDNRFYIEWSTDGTGKSNYWEVQSSADGKKFSTLALVMGPDPSKTGEEYAYKGKIDTQKTAAYYRVVHIDGSGTKQQSETIRLIKLESMSFINPAIKNKVPVLL